MDVTPQLLTEVEFRQSLRGYDVDEVDGFLEEVAASVATLRGRLQAALQRADATGQGGPMSAMMIGDAEGGVTTETITRTLLLAQQTADETVSAARDEASTLLGEANAEAERIRAEAASEAGRVVSEAQAEREAVLGAVTAEAETLAEQTRIRIEAEISTLERRHDALRQRVGAVEPELEKQRNRLIATASALTELVNDDEAFTLDLGFDEVSTAAEEPPLVDETLAEPAEPEATEVFDFDLGDAPDPVDEDAADDDAGHDGAGEAAREPEFGDPVADASLEASDAGTAESPSTSVFGAPAWTDAGPPTEPVEVLDLTDSEDAEPDIDESQV
ncbi:MAG: DivIVA domain-containing protein, partial [Acidimicrobiales bacterium]|nr:DivIVA domain-containing protein [Acidimicrobiales bacterium]